jgi:hypothetical protein
MSNMILFPRMSQFQICWLLLAGKCPTVLWDLLDIEKKKCN